MLEQHGPGQGVVRLVLREGFILLSAPLSLTQRLPQDTKLTPTVSKTAS